MKQENEQAMNLSFSNYATYENRARLMWLARGWVPVISRRAWSSNLRVFVDLVVHACMVCACVVWVCVRV